MDPSEDTAAAFERLAAGHDRAEYLLRLYVAGVTPRSQQTLARIKAVCEEHLKGRYTLEVIDVRQQPELARGGQVVVLPTLIKVLPPPLRRLVGTLRDTEAVLRGLDIRKRT